MTFEEWLKTQKIADNTIVSQLSRIARLREAYPDIDAMYDIDGCNNLMREFTYTKHEERSGRPNPTKLAINGNLYKSLATYRATLGRYIRFKQTPSDDVTPLPEIEGLTYPDGDDEIPIGFERDMQRALRLNIAQLESGLKIDDDGVERRVESGFIDITARDINDKLVVIELKTGIAGQRAVAQILSYMGDVVAEEDSPAIRGMLVAFDFDKKAVAAAKMVPSLQLMKYRFRFDFESV